MSLSSNYTGNQERKAEVTLRNVRLADSKDLDDLAYDCNE